MCRPHQTRFPLSAQFCAKIRDFSLSLTKSAILLVKGLGCAIVSALLSRLSIILKQHEAVSARSPSTTPHQRTVSQVNFNISCKTYRETPIAVAMQYEPEVVGNNKVTPVH